MVGQNSKLSGMTFAVRMKKYLHKPFREGAYGPDAYDCVGLIYSYLRDSGTEVADSFGPWNLENYYTLARGNSIREKAVLREWLLTLGTEVPERVAGDLLLIEYKDSLFPAIYVGNSRAVTVFRSKGTSPFSLLENEMKTILIIRCR